MTFTESLFQILQRQRENLERIDTGVVVSGSGGETVTLIGPPIDMVRLYDVPVRFLEEQYATAERIVTLFPVSDVPTSRVVNRIDRLIRYQIQCYVVLTDAEQERDNREKGVNNPLATKASNLVHDVRWTFYDNDLLQPIVAGVPDSSDVGLVDDAAMEVSYVSDIEYPGALFVMDVTCQWSNC